MSLVAKSMTWLAHVPVIDPLDRRNAQGFQVLLLAAALLTLIAVLSAWQEAGRFSWSIGVGLACHAGLWFSFWLVRRGQFRAAVTFVFASLLALIVLSHQVYGLRVHGGLQVAHLLPLLLGGLLLGRRALWLGLFFLLVAVVLGGIVDISRSGHDRIIREEVRAGLVLSALTFLVATVMLDRLISASRRALLRSEQLDLAYQKLAKELEEKERAQAQLLQAQKVEVLGQLAGGIAHDFNNILGVILGYTSIARSSGEFGSNTLSGIEGAARRGMMATRRLLGLGRHRMRHIEVFDACVAVRNAMILIAPLFGERVEIDVDLPPQAMPVRLDRDEFELALLNLATNARDAMPADGSFRIAVREGADGMVEVKVMDTGCGMPKDVAVRLFDPFFTTKPEGQGTGIGMAVVQRLISDADGQILVDSTPGEGTRVTLRLPPATITQSMPRIDLGGVRVLLVEDESHLRMLLTKALTDSGCRVATAATGAGALEAVEDIGKAQVVISDYRLPDIDGVTLLGRLKEQWPDALRILITSHPANEPLELEQHAITLLAKPFAPPQLLDLIARRLHDQLDDMPSDSRQARRA